MKQKQETETFAADILEAANGEDIEAVLVAAPDGDYERRNEHSDPPRERLLSWGEAQPYFAYDYDRGFGGHDCHTIFAWTKSYVLFVDHYDGATSICRVPRGPSTDMQPYMPGGG